MRHSDGGGVQCPSIRYTEPLSETGIGLSLASVGDSDDSGLADTVNGLYGTEVVPRRVPGGALKPGNSPNPNGSTGRLTGKKQSSEKLVRFETAGASC